MNRQPNGNIVNTLTVGELKHMLDTMANDDTLRVAVTCCQSGGEDYAHTVVGLVKTKDLDTDEVRVQIQAGFDQYTQEKEW